MKGIAYGVGIGPGDPELLTLKAVRLIKENEIIAVPGVDPYESVAYKIAVQAVPELAHKTLIPIDMPMIKDREKIRENHKSGAKLLEKYLEQGKNVVYLTLGDSAVYCTFTYLQPYLKEDGYESVLVNGITSFSAAAARFNIPLVEWNETLHVVPAVHKTDSSLREEGTYVLMKSASHMKEVKKLLAESGKEVFAVENCGMADERVHYSAEDIPDDASYFSLIIARDPKND